MNGFFPVKNLFPVLLFTSSLLFIPRTAAAQESTAGPAETITAAVPRNFPPEYSVDENGNPAGFAIDLMNTVADEAGIKVLYIVKDSWMEVNEAMQSGEADIIPNFGITPERQKRYLFTPPVETFRISVFVRSSTPALSGLDDLKGRTVAAVETNAAADILQHDPDINEIVFDNPNDAFLNLLSGHVDAFVYPEPAMRLLARSVRLENRIKTTGPPLTEIKRAIAVRETETGLHQRLSAAVSAFIESDEYTSLYRKWYGTPEPFWTGRRVLLVSGGLLAAALLVMLLWRYLIILRHNKQLKEQIRNRRAVESELRESEERFRGLVDSMQDVVYTLDREQRHTGVYGRWLATAGRTAEEFIGKTAEDIFGPEDGKIHWKANEKALTGHFTVYEWSLPFENGRLYYQTSLSPLYNENSEITGLVGLTREVTALRVADEQVKRNLKEKETLLKEIHHRVKNNLNVIMSLLNIQASYINSEADALSALQNSKNRIFAMALVHEKLYQAENLSSIEMGEYIKDLTGTIARSYIVHKNISIEVQTDTVRLSIQKAIPAGIILNELVSNAIKHAFPGNAAGRVLVGFHKKETGICELAVHDTGTGFSYKKPSTGSKTLGIQLVEILAEQLDGTLTVNCNHGTSVTVRFSFPDESAADSPA